MTDFVASVSPSAFGAALDAAFPIGLTWTGNFGGAGLPGVTSAAQFNFTNGSAGALTAADWQFIGTYNYTGGVFGFTQKTLSVVATAGANNANFVWAFLSTLNNSATAGQNTSGYFQSTKQAGAGATWGLLAEVIEAAPTNNPTTGTVALEVDLDCNGTDNLGHRVGVDLAIRQNQANLPSAVYANANYGFRIQNSGVSGNSVGYGFSFASGMIANVGFDTSQATINAAAFQMAQGQAIIFDGPTNQHHALFYNGSGLEYRVSGVNEVFLGATGFISLGGTQVLGQQIPGYGTPTGGSHQASFSAAGITLANLAACVAQLIVDLKTHGMIGA